MSDENNILNNEQDNNEEVTAHMQEGESITSMQSEAINTQTDEIMDEPVKKSKVHIIAGVAAVAAVIVAGAAVMGAASPEKALKKAFATTGTALAQRDSVFKNIVSPELKTILEDGSYTVSQNFKVENLPDSEELNGIGINTVMNVDNASKQGNFSIKGNYNGINLDVINAYTDNEVILLNMPMLCDTIFSVSTEDILGQIKASPVFSHYLEEADIDTQEDISFKVFDKTEVGDESREIAEIYFENLEALTKAMKYGKADTKDIELSDGTVKCKGYTVDIPSAAATNCFAGTLSQIYNCEAVQEQLKDSAAVKYATEGYSSPDEFMQEYNDTIEDITTKTIVGDVTAVFYVNKGIIVDSEIIADVTYDGDTVKFTVTGGLDTDNSLDIKLSLDNGIGNPSVAAYSDSIEKSDTLKENYSLSFGDSSESEATIKFESNYNELTGDIAASLNLDGDGIEGMAFDIAGYLNQSDIGIKFDAPSMKIQSQGESLGEFSYDLSIDKLDGEIEKPEGDIVRILEISESEFEDIYSDIQRGIFGLMMQLS